MIELTTSDGQTLSAYRADPGGAPKGAVVVVQEIFGVDLHIRKIADMFAARDYVAIAPSLFDPVKADVSLGYDDAGVARGLDLVKEIGRDRALAGIQAAVDSVKDAGKVAVVGYGWGGYLAYTAGNRVSRVACAIGYYGGGIVDDYGEKRKVPTLLHFAENDQNIPPEAVVQFRASRPDVSVFSYPGAVHGFNCDERGSYNKEAAEAALGRTLFWVSQYVEGQPPILLKNSGAYAQAKVDKKKKKKSAGGDDLGPPMD
jgi:carboxymethylenebutenolidase